MVVMPVGAPPAHHAAHEQARPEAASPTAAASAAPAPAQQIDHQQEDSHHNGRAHQEENDLAHYAARVIGIALGLILPVAVVAIVRVVGVGDARVVAFQLFYCLGEELFDSRVVISGGKVGLQVLIEQVVQSGAVKIVVNA